MLSRLGPFALVILFLVAPCLIGCGGSKDSGGESTDSTTKPQSPESGGQQAQLEIPELPEEKKAVLALKLDVKRFLDSPISSHLPLQEAFQQSQQGVINPDIFEEVESVRLYVSSPPDMASLAAMQGGQARGEIAFEFCLTADFVSKESAAELINDIRSRAEERQLDGMTVYTSNDSPYDFRVIGDKSLRVGTDAYLVREEAKLPKDALATKWNSIDDGIIQFAVDVEGARTLTTELSALLKEQAPPAAAPIVDALNEIQSLSLNVDANTDTLLNLEILAANADSAEKLKGVVGLGLMAMNMQTMAPLAELRKESETVADLAKNIMASMKPTVDGNAVRVVVPKPEGFEAAIEELGQLADKSAVMAERANRMKQMALSIHNFESVYSRMPWASGNPDFSSDLSWRVFVLPYNEESALYEKFDVGKGWQEEPNLELATSMPSLYQKAGEEGAVTDIVAVKVDPPVSRLASVVDGTSNTIMLIESTISKPWTAPQDLTPDEIVEMVQGLDDGERLFAARYDGSVFNIDKSIDEEELRAMLNPYDYK